MVENKFDFKKLADFKKVCQYESRISALKSKYYVENIEEVVEKAIKNLKDKEKSFIIYGDPQSGKTEMMIALTAKLLDEGYKIIILLVTDHLTLLNQNLNRFVDSKLNPSPRNYTEILDSDAPIKDKPLVIFCKKNSQDLKKLIDKLKDIKEKVIIDDEADYATPNSKINQKEVSAINSLTSKLISEGGIYIGVTATPARLDLNNTHKNKTSKWIKFKPHPNYTGQDHFFPIKINPDSIHYNLKILENDGDLASLKEAIFGFLINTAHLNVTSDEKGYSMLIHTSGKKIDHSEDKKHVEEIINKLSNLDEKISGEDYKSIFDKAEKKYSGEGESIVRYIMENMGRHKIIVLNSNRNKNLPMENLAANPSDPFTIIIGGNIVSRGVTFSRLLSMFFTRGVKTRFNQDTYIQRARMFGSRKDYLQYFELIIPEELFSNWHNCFIFHRLSLKSIESGNGPPVWFEGGKIRTTAQSSIDNDTVVINSGEMKSGLFDDNKAIENILKEEMVPLDKLKKISSTLGENFPHYITEFVEGLDAEDKNNMDIKYSTVMTWGKDTNKIEISRDKGFIRGEDKHQFLILFNDKGKARLFYRPSTKNIRLLVNQKI